MRKECRGDKMRVSKIRVGLGAGAAILFTLAAAPARSGEPAAISEGAAMGVRVAMTLAEAKEATPDLSWSYEPRYMVDFSAACAAKGGEELFCALVYENEKEDGSDQIEAVVVSSPALATDQGLRVGMKLADAAAVLGTPRLAYHLENEGREFLNFSDAPGWLSFRASSASSKTGYAGVYPPLPSGEVYQETGEYAPDAVLESLWLN